ncbi:hypothetical protein UR09_01410 [Candidatus Nitromaritima sp. SCGC AAA799-A02]|nr:hypothetical protein UR09_01410 [Candidatus Nitromaritima sp. SCGC AAA799-A02]
MKSLATINEKDIETIKMALNDSISDMNTELKEDMTDRQRVGILEYKNKYTKVFDKLRQNPSIYSLSEAELDTTAGGLNDAIQLIEENLSDDLTEQEREEIMSYKNDCTRLVELLAG